MPSVFTAEGDTNSLVSSSMRQKKMSGENTHFLESKKGRGIHGKSHSSTFKKGCLGNEACQGSGKNEKRRECPIPRWEELLPGWTGGLVLFFEPLSLWLWSPGPGFGIGTPSCKMREDLFSFYFIFYIRRNCWYKILLLHLPNKI